MFVLRQGRTQEGRLQIQDCDVFKLHHFRAVCRNTDTHEIEKDADEPSPEVTVEAVWCMAFRDIVEDAHCDCIEKHDVSSEHRDQSKFTEFPEHRDASTFRQKFVKSIDTGENSRKVITKIETGQKFGKVVTKIKMHEQDRNRRQKSGHE